MGDRYLLTVKCPNCGKVAKQVYYAPTCELDTYECKACNNVVDLIEYTGITAEDASNHIEIKSVISKLENSKLKA